MNKLRNQNGLVRAAVPIIAVICVLLFILIAIPVLHSWEDRANESDCLAGLDTANNFLAINYLQNMDMTVEEALDIAAETMDGPDMCPAHGNIYIAVDEDADMPYTVICGIHDTDRQRRCKYNASYVFDKVKEAVLEAQKNGDEYPESVTVRSNNMNIKAELVDENTPLKHGTDSTVGYSGTVCYYSIVGHSDFGSNSGLSDGQIWYFSYADEYYAANYSSKDGWSGDAYGE